MSAPKSVISLKMISNSSNLSCCFFDTTRRLLMKYNTAQHSTTNAIHTLFEEGKWKKYGGRGDKQNFTPREMSFQHVKCFSLVLNQHLFRAAVAVKLRKWKTMETRNKGVKNERKGGKEIEAAVWRRANAKRKAVILLSISCCCP